MSSGNFLPLSLCLASTNPSALAKRGVMPPLGHRLQIFISTVVFAPYSIIVSSYKDEICRLNHPYLDEPKWPSPGKTTPSLWIHSFNNHQTSTVYLRRFWFTFFLRHENLHSVSFPPLWQISSVMPTVSPHLRDFNYLTTLIQFYNS